LGTGALATATQPVAPVLASRIVQRLPAPHTVGSCGHPCPASPSELVDMDDVEPVLLDVELELDDAPPDPPAPPPPSTS
jgi:hypothetical protein